MTGLELLKAPATTAGEIADIISKPGPPIVPEVCDHISCRECWLAWLTGNEPTKKKGPTDEQTAPDEEGLHPNLVEMYRRSHREARFILRAYAACGQSSNERHPARNAPQPPTEP